MDKQRYCLCKLRWDGPVHCGKILDGVCFLVCASSHRMIALPVTYGDVECQHCLKLMKLKKITVNTSYELVPAAKAQLG